MPRKPHTTTDVGQEIHVGHRVAIGIVSLSLALLSLSLAVALFISPISPTLLLFAPVKQASTPPTTATAVTLTWTASGDDGAVGQASAYDLRYSLSPLTAETFSAATSVDGVAAPQPAGTRESFTVTNLQPSTTYYFALKSSDDAGNVSDVSNIATATTAASSQACVPTYECSTWSACVDGKQTRTCSTTNGCPAGLDQPLTTQQCTVASPPSTGGGPVRLRQHVIVVGAGVGYAPVVRIVSPSRRKVVREFKVFPSANTTGVNVAVGDLDGDHNADIVVGRGAGRPSTVRVFSAAGKKVAEFNPYPTVRRGGVELALGDVNGDGQDELVTVLAAGPAQIRVFRWDASRRRFVSLTQLLASARTATSGYTLAAGDLNLDGRAEVLLASKRRSSMVSVYTLKSNSLTRTARFKAYPIAFTSGIRLAVGDVTGDGLAEIITAPGSGYWTDVKAFTAAGRFIAHFLPASTAFRGGFDLATLDVNGDGRDEIIVGPYSKADPNLSVYRYSGLRRRFERLQRYAVWPRAMRAGLRVGSR